MNQIESTTCYSYKVEMIIQVLAKDEKTAKEQLDNNNGYVSSRLVTLVDSVSLFSGEANASI